MNEKIASFDKELELLPRPTRPQDHKRRIKHYIIDYYRAVSNSSVFKTRGHNQHSSSDGLAMGLNESKNLPNILGPKSVFDKTRQEGIISKSQNHTKNNKTKILTVS